MADQIYIHQCPIFLKKSEYLNHVPTCEFSGAPALYGIAGILTSTSEERKNDENNHSVYVI
jgi:hypothetical protein